MTSPDGGMSTATTDPAFCEPPPPPPPVSAGNLWQLEADPGRIEQAARAWQLYARQARASSQDIDDRVGRIYGNGWTGTTADTYDEHRRKLNKDIRGGADLADQIADALERAAASLRSTQTALDQSLHAITSQVPGASTASGLEFYPADEADVAKVKAAVREAQEIRSGLDDRLLDSVVAMDRTVSEWRTLASALQAAAEGTTDPFTLPPEAPGTYIIRNGDDVVINTGPGNDKVSVRVDPATGEQIVTVNGKDERFPPHANIVVRAGEGNDELSVQPGTAVRVTLLGGTGDDMIRGGAGDETILGGKGADTIMGGEGNDRISGESGRDYLDGYRGNDTLDGGLGDDTVYGLGGHDRMSGGEGRDYMEGGTGADTMSGGAGNDMMSGGRDNDTMRGGAGDDRMYAGYGRDTVDGGTGTDTSFSQSDDNVGEAEKVVTVELKDVGGYIKVEGSPEFVERVQADLDMLRSSPRGQMMLEALDHGHEESRSSMAGAPIIGGFFNQGDTLTIREYVPPPGAGDNSFAHRDVDPDTKGRQMRVDYLPTFDTLYDGPPVTILYHELAHVYDYTSETLADGTYTGSDNPGVPNRERAAAGLPIDHDNDPSTPNRIDPRHPFDYTENGLRDEMGAPNRPRY
jgi:uncharacterized protein YukE